MEMSLECPLPKLRLASQPAFLYRWPLLLKIEKVGGTVQKIILSETTMPMCNQTMVELSSTKIVSSILAYQLRWLPQPNLVNHRPLLEIL